MKFRENLYGFLNHIYMMNGEEEFILIFFQLTNSLVSLNVLKHMGKVVRFIKWRIGVGNEITNHLSIFENDFFHAEAFPHFSQANTIEKVEGWSRQWAEAVFETKCKFL